MNLGLGMGLQFGASSPASWDPSKLPNLLLILDAAKGVTITGGKVSAWADQSGSGDANRNLAQSNALHRPTQTLVNPAYNDDATLDFSHAATDYLQSGAWSAAPVQPCTVFVVGNDDGSGSNETYVDGAAEFANLIDTNDGYALGIYAGASLDSQALASSSPRIIGGEFNGATSKTYVNSATASHTGNAGATNATGITVGAAHGASGPLGGSIAYVVVVAGIMSAGDRAKLVAYLGARYGIATT